MIAFVLDIPPAIVHTLNARGHWSKHRQKIAMLRLLGRNAWVNEKHPQLQTATVDVSVLFPDNRRRDTHNDMPTLKALIDGMVDGNMLPDDNHHHLDGPHLHRLPQLCPKGAGRRYVFEIREGIR